jgi:prepilin-type N-terminal cleavage/methylation domain-containing protein
MKKQRYGFSLVEMIVVITVGAALTGLAVTTLASLMHASRAMDDHVYRIATIRRLAEQFRDDVHAAAKSQNVSGTLRVPPEKTGAPGVPPAKIGTRSVPDTIPAVRPTGQRFDLAPNHVVTYVLRPGIVDRTEEVDHVVRSRDSFFLPGKCVASIVSSTDPKSVPAGTTVLALVIVPGAAAAEGQGPAAQSPAPLSGRSSLRIEAVLARDHRFTRPK